MTGDDVGEQDATMAAEAAEAPTAFRDPVPFEQEQAWSNADSIPEVSPPARASWLRTGVVAAAITAAAAAVIGGLVAWRSHTAEPPASAHADPESSSPAAPTWPTTAEDKLFVQQLEQRAVKVSNEHWYSERGRTLCQALVDNGAAPGGHTVNLGSTIIAEDEKNWDSGQARNFVAAAFTAYCPQLWGPPPEEIAKLPPDDRYVALSADRMGWILSPEDVAYNTNAARNQCRELTSGTPRSELVRTVATGSAHVDEDMAQDLIDMAIEVYCPELQG